jgi:divalent metal cation (Fe/Co/Zn/Cd) transporter
MAELIQIGPQASKAGASSCAVRPPAKAVFWLQGITLVWMLFECGISLTAAATACSPSMLAFGSDSLVELLSATVVLLQFLPRFPLSSERANRTAGVLLFALAAVVALVAIASLAPHRRPETSLMGIGITIAALVVMPILARLKRREAIRTGNAALAADAVQSATCAYLAAIALLGLAANALFKIAWLDSLAAVAALPLLIKEGRDAWRGKSCACC